MAVRIGTWDANPPADAVTHYHTYVDGVKVGTLPASTRTFTYTVSPGVRRFGVTAVNTANVPAEQESEAAEVIQTVTGKPGKPTNFAVSIVA